MASRRLVEPRQIEELRRAWAQHAASTIGRLAVGFVEPLEAA